MKTGYSNVGVDVSVGVGVTVGVADGVAVAVGGLNVAVGMIDVVGATTVIEMSAVGVAQAVRKNVIVNKKKKTVLMGLLSLFHVDDVEMALYDFF
jgi:hypothetical protein